MSQCNSTYYIMTTVRKLRTKLGLQTAIALSIVMSKALLLAIDTLFCFFLRLKTTQQPTSNYMYTEAGA